MAIGRLWAGRSYGTNTGNLFVSLEGNDAVLSGTLRLNEPNVGILVYSVQGSFDGHRLSLAGHPRAQIEGVTLGQLSATASLTSKGELWGEWETSAGAAGTFQLFPHDQRQPVEGAESALPDQLHTGRHNFRAIEVDREQIIAVADALQGDFKGRVAVTVVASTEQTRFLPDFKATNFPEGRASIIKLFVQEPEENGINRLASIEFGPHVNTAMTQGSNEAWVLGMLEKLKRATKPLERTYATNIKRLGFGINQLLVVGLIAYLPSLTTLRDRIILVAGVATLIVGINWLHKRYLPFAMIYLGRKPIGVLARITPPLLSWVIAASAGIVAALLGAYLQGRS